MMTIAVYPGSFDPITNGHLDIIQRSINLFDNLIVAVAKNTEKNALFTVAERIEIIKDAVREYPNVNIRAMDGLLVDFARNVGAKVIIRGLRAVSDFEYEYQMALMNKRLAPDIETIFMMTSGKYAFLSSSVIREVSMLGGNIKSFVPEKSYEFLMKKFNCGG